LLRGSARRAAWTLLGVEAMQAVIGTAQYNLGLPVALVAAHLLGAALLVAAAATMAERALVVRQPMKGSAAAATNSSAR
jgi:cytochrome c oxidase assembly protein subunit 15